MQAIRDFQTHGFPSTDAAAAAGLAIDASAPPISASTSPGLQHLQGDARRQRGRSTSTSPTAEYGVKLVLDHQPDQDSNDLENIF